MFLQVFCIPAFCRAASFPSRGQIAYNNAPAFDLSALYYTLIEETSFLFVFLPEMQGDCRKCCI
jgi:hypothetical protein